MMSEHEERLCAMLTPDQKTWDLSPNDVKAIAWILAEVERWRSNSTLKDLQDEALRQHLRADRAEAEVERLQAIVNRMQKTRDGAPVTIGDMVWVRRLTTGAIMSGVVVELHGGRPGSVAWIKLDTEFPVATLTWLLSECYGSREAVEAAGESDESTRK